MQKIKILFFVFFFMIIVLERNCFAMQQAQRKVLMKSGLRSIAANALIKMLPKPQFGRNGAWEQLTKLIATLNVFDTVPEIKLLLIKYWYLNYGHKDFSPDVDYDFSGRGLNICFSIAELAAFNRLPGIIGDFLNLMHYRINDLDGLKEIPGIEHIKSLYLNNNPVDLSTGHVFDDLCKLEYLELKRTGLEMSPNGIFDKLTHLSSLDLRNNPIGDEFMSYLRSLQRAKPGLRIWLGPCYY